MVIPQSEYARGGRLFLALIISRELSTWYGVDAVGEMKRLPSLLRSAAIAAALGVAVLGAAPLMAFDDAYASGRDDDRDDDDHDWDDNSGHGNSDDWDNDRDWDDDDDRDNSGPGSGDDWDDDDDRSGHGGGDDDDHDNSGPGGGDDDNDHGDNSGHSDDHDYDVIDFVAEHAIYSVEYDSHGDEYLPGEIVFVGTARDLAAALNLGFREIRVQHLSSGGVMARLGMPGNVNFEQSRAMLAQAAPNAIVTLNNIYRSAQSYRTASNEPPPVRSRVRLRGTLGVIDTGVDVAAVPTNGALLSQRAFAGPSAVARPHGSTVVAIAVSRGVRVQVADVFGHSPDGALAASADRIAAAIDWMIDHRIAVINISVEGPPNPVLQEMVRRAAERGHIIVAAAGNGGPAARPIFPAAFEGVLAVTAIDDEGRPYIRANRGDYIDFAAPGVNIVVDVRGTPERVSGTSFAAPVIAAEAATQLQAPSPTEAARVLARMRARAEDLGEPGRDDVYGWGALRD